MAALVDTNVLVYCFDPFNPEKQKIAVYLLREGLRHGTMTLSHQTLVEFVAATTRPRESGRDLAPLLSPTEAWREAEELRSQFPVLYPTATTLATAVRGAALYGLGWLDALLWAQAAEHGITELLSEDFEHHRLYGTVRAINPFETAETLNESGGVDQMEWG